MVAGEVVAGMTLELIEFVAIVGINTTIDELGIGNMDDDAPGKDGEVDNTGIVNTELGNGCPFVVVGCIRVESIVTAAEADETITFEPLGTIVVIRELIAGNTSVVMTYITPEVCN